MTYFLFTSVILLKILYLNDFIQLLLLDHFTNCCQIRHRSMIRLPGFRIVKLGQVENSRWPLLLKITKTTISSEPIGIVC